MRDGEVRKEGSGWASHSPIRGLLHQVELPIRGFLEKVSDPTVALSRGPNLEVEQHAGGGHPGEGPNLLWRQRLGRVVKDRVDLTAGGTRPATVKWPWAFLYGRSSRGGIRGRNFRQRQRFEPEHGLGAIGAVRQLILRLLRLGQHSTDS